MEIVLHIGTDKTGSTAIQNTLSLNRDWFLNHSVYVPSTGFGRANGHAMLLNKLDTTELTTLNSELLQASASGSRAAILSWEGMVRYNKGQIRTLLRHLSPFPVRILIYVREQAEVIQSGHLQWVKMSSAARRISTLAQPTTPLHKIFTYLFLRNPRRNYYRTLRRWQQSLPNGLFSVRVFDKRDLFAGDIAADFLHQLGLATDSDYNNGLPITNPSLDVESALLIESWKNGTRSEAEIEALIDVSQSLIDREGAATKYFLDRDAVIAIRQYFRKSNLQMARHFMPSAEHPFRESSECWRQESFAQIEARAAERSQWITEVNKTPTLVGTAVGSSLSTDVALVSGWSKPEDWGVWARDSESTLRFRIMSRRMIGEVDAVRLAIRGRYYGENKSSGVTVNGIDFGELRLSENPSEIVLPFTALYPNQIVEMTLTHKHPISPFKLEGKKDDRPLALALMSLDCTLIENPH